MVAWRVLIPARKDLIIKVFNPAEHRGFHGHFAPGQVTEGRQPHPRPQLNGWVQTHRGDGGGNPEPQGMPTGWIPEPLWIEGQQIWEARGEAIWAAHEWRPLAAGPETTHYVNIKAGDVFRTGREGGFVMVAQSAPQPSDSIGKKFNIPVRHVEPNGTLSEPYNYRVTGRLETYRIGRLKDTTPRPLQFEEDTKGNATVFHANGQKLGEIKQLKSGNFSVFAVNEKGQLQQVFRPFTERQSAINVLGFIHNLRVLEEEAAKLPPGAPYHIPLSEQIHEGLQKIMSQSDHAAIAHLQEMAQFAHEDGHDVIANHLDHLVTGIKAGGMKPHLRLSQAAAKRTAEEIAAHKAELKRSVAEQVKVLGAAYQKRVHDLIDTITSEPTAGDKPKSGNVARTTILSYENGQKSVRKIQDAMVNDAEEAALLVAHAIGANVPVAVRVNDTELHLEFIDGPTAAEPFSSHGGLLFSSVPGLTMDTLDQLIDSPAGRLIGFADRLTGNWDRNSGNWMITGEPGNLQPAGIDWGMAFRELWNVEPGRLVHGFGDNPFVKADPAFDLAQFKEWRTQLQNLESVFRRFEGPLRGREEWWAGHEWWDRMMQEFDHWENAARSNHPNVDVLPQPKPKKGKAKA